MDLTPKSSDNNWRPTPVTTTLWTPSTCQQPKPSGVATMLERQHQTEHQPHQVQPRPTQSLFPQPPAPQPLAHQPQQFPGMHGFGAGISSLMSGFPMGPTIDHQQPFMIPPRPAMFQPRSVQQAAAGFVAAAPALPHTLVYNSFGQPVGIVAAACAGGPPIMLSPPTYQSLPGQLPPPIYSGTTTLTTTQAHMDQQTRSCSSPPNHSHSSLPTSPPQQQNQTAVSVRTNTDTQSFRQSPIRSSPVSTNHGPPLTSVPNPSNGPATTCAQIIGSLPNGMPVYRSPEGNFFVLINNQQTNIGPQLLHQTQTGLPPSITGATTTTTCSNSIQFSSAGSGGLDSPPPLLNLMGEDDGKIENETNEVEKNQKPQNEDSASATGTPETEMDSSVQDRENSSPDLKTLFRQEMQAANKTRGSITRHLVDGFVIQESVDTPFPVGGFPFENLIPEHSEIKEPATTKEEKHESESSTNDSVKSVGSLVDENDTAVAVEAKESTPVEDEEKHPRDWTVSEVCEWVQSLPGALASTAEAFERQEIDGQALLLLTEDHLVRTLEIKLGPAVKLCAAIRNLKNQNI